MDDDTKSQRSLASISQPPLPVALSSPQPVSNPCENFYATVCGRRGITRDTTGFVKPDFDGEMEAIHFYQSIIKKHNDWDPEQVDQEFIKEVFNSHRRARLLSAFQEVKRKMEHWIDEQPENIFTDIEKFQLKFRIKKTKLELPPYLDEPDILTRNDIYYERTDDGKSRIRVGGGYLFVTKSWFNWIFTFAHELAHSIDHCELRSIQLAFPAYDKLNACFFQNKLVSLSKVRLECGDNDQLSETFADWLAVQITMKVLIQYSTEFDKVQILRAARNSVRDLCEQDDGGQESDTEFHPSPQIRIEKIFGQNPDVRKLLGCPALESIQHYCQFEPHTPLQEGIPIHAK